MCVCLSACVPVCVCVPVFVCVYCLHICVTSHWVVKLNGDGRIGSRHSCLSALDHVHWLNVCVLALFDVPN